MEKLIDHSFGWVLIKILVGGLLGLLACLLLSSCGPDRRLAHTPSRAEIRRAMQYSTWEYNNVRPTKRADVSVYSSFAEGVTH